MGRRERKNERRKQVLMSVFIAFIMIFSAFGVLIGTQTNDIRYGDFKFDIENNAYMTTINSQRVRFYSLPYQNFVNISPAVVSRIQSSAFVLTAFDPGQDPASLPYIEQVRFDLAQHLNKTVYGGVLVQSDVYASLPVIGCANASIMSPMLVFNVSDRPEVVDAGSCIYFNGKATDFIWARDNLLYRYYGVMADGGN